MRKAKHTVNDHKLTSQLTGISQCCSGLTNLIPKLESSSHTVQNPTIISTLLIFESDLLRIRIYI